MAALGAAAQQDMITPELRAALERRGVDSVRALLVQATGPGPQASVYVDSVITTVPRADVEEWLVEIAGAVKAKDEIRHAQIIRMARWTFAVAVVAAVAGIVAAWPVVRGWLR